MIEPAHKSKEGGRFEYGGDYEVDEQNGQIAHCATIVTISTDMTRPGFCTD